MALQGAGRWRPRFERLLHWCHWSGPGEGECEGEGEGEGEGLVATRQYSKGAQVVS
jgi:hypothetical protein